MMKLFKNLTSKFISPKYIVTYAPEKSRRPDLPIQQYQIIGRPNQGWKSSANKRLFTAVNANNGEYLSFRADRVLSINFSGFKVLTPELRYKTCKILEG
jgi:hypothetical protein